jgi:hypothetical protein
MAHQQRCDSHFLSYISKWWLRLSLGCRGGEFIRNDSPARLRWPCPVTHQEVVAALVIVVLNLDKFNTCYSIVVLPCIMFPNPGNYIARIAQKKRTSSCRIALLLLGESARVCNTSDFKGKKLHLSNETVPAMGEGDRNWPCWQEYQH